MRTGCTGFPGHSSLPLPAVPGDAPALPEHTCLPPCTSHTTAAVPAAQRVPFAMQQCGTAPCAQGCGRTGCIPGPLPSDAPHRTVRLSGSDNRDAYRVSRVFVAYFSPPYPFPGNRKALAGFTLQRLRSSCYFWPFMELSLFHSSSIMIPYRNPTFKHFLRNIAEHFGTSALIFLLRRDFFFLQHCQIISPVQQCRFVNNMLHRGSRSVIPVFSKKS